MPGRLVALLAAATLGAGPSSASEGLSECRKVASDPARLACYDGLPLPDDHDRIVFSGSGSKSLPAFHAKAQSVLRFHSDDAVFVAYLLDRHGAVVQNLHHGGRGAGQHLVEAAGSYRLQINAIGGWRVEVVSPSTRNIVK